MLCLLETRESECCFWKRERTQKTDRIAARRTRKRRGSGKEGWERDCNTFPRCFPPRQIYVERDIQRDLFQENRLELGDLLLCQLHVGAVSHNTIDAFARLEGVCCPLREIDRFCHGTETRNGNCLQTEEIHVIGALRLESTAFDTRGNVFGLGTAPAAWSVKK